MPLLPLQMPSSGIMPLPQRRSRSRSRWCWHGLSAAAAADVHASIPPRKSLPLHAS